MLQIGGTHIFLLVANYLRSLFEWCVRNDAITEGRETNPEIARETHSDVAAESMDSEVGPSAPSQNGAEAEAASTSEVVQSLPSQNGAEAEAASTSEVVQSSPSRNRAPAEDTQTGLRVALWAIEISACGVIAVLAGFIGNQITSSTHKLFFKASMISLCVSFASGSCILVLKIFRPNIQCLTVVVKILIIAAIGSMSLAVGFGVTFYFRKA